MINPILAYGPDGRMVGSYVYVFICEHLGQAVVKIGISDRPFHRMDEIRQGCPFKAVGFATINVYTRKVALKIEAELLHEFQDHRTRGEWLSFSPEDKGFFNDTLRKVLDRYKKTGWPLKIVKAPMTAKMVEALPVQKRNRRKTYMDLPDFVRLCEKDLKLKNQWEGKSFIERMHLARELFNREKEIEEGCCNPTASVG